MHAIAPNENASAVPSGVRAGKNILLADDDKFLLDMYSMKFAQEGYTVQSSLSAHDAIEHLKRGFAADAILFDLTMPECDGFQFLELLRKEDLAQKALKVALTNQSTDEEKKKALDLGADIFLVKATMIPSEVVNTVALALKSHPAA